MTDQPKRTRGRPAKADALSPAARVAAYRARLADAGGRELQIFLDSKEAEAIDALRAPGESDQAVIKRLLRQAR